MTSNLVIQTGQEDFTNFCHYRTSCYNLENFPVDVLWEIDGALAGADTIPANSAVITLTNSIHACGEIHTFQAFEISPDPGPYSDPLEFGMECDFGEEGGVTGFCCDSSVDETAEDAACVDDEDQSCCPCAIVVFVGPACLDSIEAEDMNTGQFGELIETVIFESNGSRMFRFCGPLECEVHNIEIRYVNCPN
jgi:hypothetical protein